MLKMLTKPRRRPIRVGPQDNGKRMSLSDFDKAIAQEGYLYELGKGIIEVSDVPHPSHWAQLQHVRNQLILYQAAHPEIVNPTSAVGPRKNFLAAVFRDFCSARPVVIPKSRCSEDKKWLLTSFRNRTSRFAIWIAIPGEN